MDESKRRKSRRLGVMDRERRAGTRTIHGPEDCPASRIQGCDPCVMEQFGVVCGARKKKEDD